MNADFSLRQVALVMAIVGAGPGVCGVSGDAGPVVLAARRADKCRKHLTRSAARPSC